MGRLVNEHRRATSKEDVSIYNKSEKKKKKEVQYSYKKKRERPQNKSVNTEEKRKVSIEKEKGQPIKKRKKKKLTKKQIEELRKKRRKEGIVESIKFIIPIFLVAVLVFFFILKTSSHRVDGSSMNPTLVDGDRVIVTRTKTPQRYDVITFKPPVESEFQYVKRVIGMPGDLIAADSEYIYINHQTEKLPENMDYLMANELPDGTIKLDVSDKVLEQLSALDKIPNNCYFVLGDNRNNSSDSREFGLVEGNSIEGVVSFRTSPFNKIGLIR